jgi:hypothetical protein
MLASWAPVTTYVRISLRAIDTARTPLLRSRVRRLRGGRNVVSHQLPGPVDAGGDNRLVKAGLRPHRRRRPGDELVDRFHVELGDVRHVSAQSAGVPFRRGDVLAFDDSDRGGGTRDGTAKTGG